MMGFEQLSRSIKDIHYYWYNIVRDIDVEKNFGRIGVDGYGISLGRYVRIVSAITSLCE